MTGGEGADGGAGDALAADGADATAAGTLALGETAVVEAAVALEEATGGPGGGLAFPEQATAPRATESGATKPEA